MGIAREIFSSMTPAAQNEALSRFLMYKIAVRCNEQDLAAECLQMISSASPDDPKLLYACVLDAQQVGDKRQTLAALQLVLEKTAYGATSVNVASLLRLTISLTVKSLEEIAQNPEDSVEFDVTLGKLCVMYEKGNHILAMRGDVC